MNSRVIDVLAWRKLDDNLLAMACRLGRATGRIAHDKRMAFAYLHTMSKMSIGVLFVEHGAQLRARALDESLDEK
jgi:hypothetical protein